MLEDESTDSIEELFAKALSYDHVFTEISTKKDERLQSSDIPEGLIFETVPLPDIPIVVTLPKTWKGRSPRFVHPWYLKIEWEELPTTVKDDIVIPDLDVINAQEDRLAKKLRSCCDSFGKETDDGLVKSANTMVGMGRLYLDRSISCSALVTIITYIKDGGIFENISERYERASKMQYDLEPYINDVSQELAEEAGATLPEDGVKVISSALKSIIENCSPQASLINATNSDGDARVSSTDHYLEKVVAHFKVEQKLSLIKAAGLVIAGKVRFIQMKDEPRQKLAEEMFCSVLREVLLSAGSRESPEIVASGFLARIDLVLFAKRTVRGDDLKDIVYVEKGDSDAVQREKEVMKIFQIRKLCERNALSFVDFMCEISEKCQQILGKAPCHFAIVGLGSLARKEVTLYSDFEHAIVLQNDVEDFEDWPSILEYFRWYTVLFHVIVIGLGETVLPGLDIRGLCEEGGGKCWFYDAFTPNGVSFDGMMPHACKIPLGRTGKTKFKNHTVELIQTARKMAQFLTVDEDIKNGYFLKEVMSSTCFVNGDVEVYESFLEECRCITSREEPDNLATRVAKYILLNPLETVSGQYVPFHAKEESNKSLTYRPLTMHLGYFAQVCGIQCKSSFEIIDEMKKTEILDADSYHTLASALAVTMELNFKVYHKAGNQRITVLPWELAVLVGERSWLDCQVVLDVLRDYTKIMPPVRCTKIGLPRTHSMFWKIQSCVNLPILNLFNRAAKRAFDLLFSTLEEYTRGDIGARRAGQTLQELFGCLRHCFLRMYLRRFAGTQGNEVLVFRRDLPEGESNELHACEWSCQKILQLEDKKVRSEELLSSAYQSLCVIRFNQKRYEEGLEYFERWQELTGGRERDQVDMWMYEMLMRIEVMGNEYVVEYIKQKLLEDILRERMLVLIVIRCQMWIKAGRLAVARRELLKLSFAVKSYSGEMTEYSTEYLLRIIREIQKDNNFRNHVGTSNLLLKSAMSKNVMKLRTDRERKDEKTAIDEDVRLKVNQAQQKVTRRELPDGSGILLLMNNLSNMLPVCFTHDELLGMANVIFSKSKVASDLQMRVAPHAFALMAVFEGAKAQDVQTALHAFHEAPRAVKAYRALQPFIYGFMKSSLNEQQKSTMRRYDNVLRAIFRDQAQHKLFDSALSDFVNLRFRESLESLWKICHLPGIAQNVKKRALELFITVVLAVLLDRKRRSQYSYFTKMRELSTKQLQWVRAVQTMKNKDFSKRNIERSKLLIFRDLPLVRVYNFAMNGNDQHPGRMCFFYWRILHHPTESKVVQKAAIFALFDAVCTANFASNHPVSSVRFWP